MKKTLLFSPVGIVHDRNVEKFEKALPEWNIRRIYHPNLPWSSFFKKEERDACAFRNNKVPKGTFEGVKAVVCFSAQPQVAFLGLAEEALFRHIPVIAIEEVYQMALQQGYVNEYFLPLDHFFVASDYEKEKFLEIGVPESVAETMGCPFRLGDRKIQSEDHKKNIRKMFGCDPERPVAVVCLTYLGPDGETHDVRRKLLTMVNKGIPKNYELIVKAHPAEEKSYIEQFIKKFAPRAKIIDSHMQIDKVLESADILFNRGNSQVIIDALDKQVPVVIVPVGKESLFHGLMDIVIANEAGDIEKIFGLIKIRGMELYRPVLERYLSISLEESLTKVTSRIAEIAENNELYKPEERLLEFALFWAWMGYNSQSYRLFNTLKKTSRVSRAYIQAAERLVSRKANYEDVSTLKKWAAHGYREWIIKSLWVRLLYLTRKRMSFFDREWLRDFPPRMNRYHFLPFAFMLGWCYTRSGLPDEAKELAGKIYGDYYETKNTAKWARVLSADRGFYKNLEYWRMRMNYSLKTALKDRIYANTFC